MLHLDCTFGLAVLRVHKFALKFDCQVKLDNTLEKVSEIFNSFCSRVASTCYI